MDSKLRKMGILASMAVILLVALAVMYVNREQLSPTSGQNTAVSGAQNAGDGEAVDPVPEGTGETDTAEADGRIGNDLKAFLKDNTFFDPDVNPILEAAKDNSHRLSLVATSVEKDLRIQIVDNEGVPVTGESFYVRVDGLGDYKDLDQDGVIYIADLDSGDYYMELLPIEGYKVPITETKVHVKEKVEYLAIDDISLLIKTEDEVDADAEDSAVAGALADADKTEQHRQEIIGNRQSELYSEVLQGYKDEAEWVLNEKVWKTVTFDNLFTTTVESTETETVDSTEPAATEEQTETTGQTESVAETEAVDGTESVQ